MHEKRLTAPKSWKINRKELEWITPISPGPHSKDQALPVVVLLRDVLGIVRDKREVETLLENGKVKVDGNIIKDLGFPVGILDSLTIGDKSYRIIIEKKKIKAISIDDPGKKIVKITSKKANNGQLEYGFHDGRNIGSDKEFEKGNSLLLKIPSKEVLESLPLKEGSYVLVYKGGHKGKLAKIEEINKMNMEEDRVKLKRDGENFETLLKYVVTVGEDSPLIKLRSDKE